MEEYHSWGENVWEDKIQTQDEKGVIHGGRHTLKGIEKQKREVVKYLDKKIFPKIPKKSKIIDAGVGPLARFSIEFAKKGYDVTGVDVSKTTLKYAQKHVKEKGFDKIKFIQKDLTNLKDIKEKFDLVFCFGTFGHIPKIFALETLRGFEKILKKEGFCLIHFWVEERLGFQKILKRTIYKILHKIKVKRAQSFEVNCSSYKLEEIKDLVNRTGFTIIEKNKDGLFLLKKI